MDDGMTVILTGGRLSSCMMIQDVTWTSLSDVLQGREKIRPLTDTRDSSHPSIK